jgi:hypothetical protein
MFSLITGMAMINYFMAIVFERFSKRRVRYWGRKEGRKAFRTQRVDFRLIHPFTESENGVLEVKISTFTFKSSKPFLQLVN